MTEAAKPTADEIARQITAALDMYTDAAVLDILVALHQVEGAILELWRKHGT